MHISHAVSGRRWAQVLHATRRFFLNPRSSPYVWLTHYLHAVSGMYPSVDFRLHLMMRAILLGVLSHLSHHARKLKLQLLVLSITVKLVLLMLQQRFLFFHLYSLVGIILFGLVIWLCFQLQIRYLDTRSASNDEVKLFEYKLLGEVRMLGALRKHRSIVDIYGHQLSSKWVQVDGDKEYRVLQSIVLMEYVNGGSLKVNHLSCRWNCIFFQHIS